MWFLPVVNQLLMGTKLKDWVSSQRLCSQPPLESSDYIVGLSIVIAMTREARWNGTCL